MADGSGELSCDDVGRRELIGQYRQLTELGMHLALVGPYENWIQVAEMMPDV